MHKFTINPSSFALTPPHGIISYVIVINWKTKHPSFEALDCAADEVAYICRGVVTWTTAYNLMLEVIREVENPHIRSALRRAITPVPLGCLGASTTLQSIGPMADAAYHWKFVGTPGDYDVRVDESKSLFWGIADYNTSND